MKDTILLYVGMLGVGLVLSLIITTMSCSKRDFGISAKEGAIFSLFPTVTYFLTTKYEMISGPFVRVFAGWVSEPESAYKYAIGYLMMLSIWIGTTRMYHTAEADVCQPSVDEMAKFKADLMKKLDAKEKEKEENDKKPTA